jgi:hypothetical protein
MLSFEVIESGKTIQICADDEGLSLLRKALERVTSSGHLHLRTVAKAGTSSMTRILGDKPRLGKS